VKPLIGLTIGDQAGIGTEIIDKAIKHLKHLCNFRIIGEQLPKEKIIYGKVVPYYGRLAGLAITEAIDLALSKKIDAVVTAPINKEAFNKGGWHYPGHTEMFAELTKAEHYAMMLVHKNLRVIHVTTHTSLRRALDLITQQRIVDVIKLGNDTCKNLGIEQPRIAVCGLNPHLSDGGLMGDEEEVIIKPAIEKSGINCKLYPADIAFAKAYGGACDCVVAMYHDQGHIPVKTLGFRWSEETNNWNKVDGVNITCGLPIIRTSPDHGVAFGKAGKGIADPTSMISAIKIAVTLVKNRGRKCPI